MLFWLAQGIAGISFIINVLGMQFNDKKKIILSVIFGGGTSIASLCLLGAISGSWMQIIFVFQAIINYFIIKKGKRIPNWLIIFYIVIVIISSVLIYEELLDILPLISTVLHTLVIVQDKEKWMRVINLGSVMCWIPYYIIYQSYGTLATSCVVFVSTLIAIYRYDIRGENSEGSNHNRDGKSG